MPSSIAGTINRCVEIGADYREAITLASADHADAGIRAFAGAATRDSLGNTGSAERAAYLPGKAD